MELDNWLNLNKRPCWDSIRDLFASEANSSTAGLRYLIKLMNPWLIDQTTGYHSLNQNNIASTMTQNQVSVSLSSQFSPCWHESGRHSSYLHTSFLRNQQDIDIGMCCHLQCIDHHSDRGWDHSCQLEIQKYKGQD